MKRCFIISLAMLSITIFGQKKVDYNSAASAFAVGRGITYVGTGQFGLGTFMLGDTKTNYMEYCWLFKENEEKNIAYTYHTAFYITQMEFDEMYYNDPTLYIVNTDHLDPHFNFGLGIQKQFNDNLFAGISIMGGLGMRYIKHDRMGYPDLEEAIQNNEDIYQIILVEDGDVIRTDVSITGGYSERFFDIKHSLRRTMTNSCYIGFAYPITKNPDKRTLSLYSKLAINHYYYRWFFIRRNEFPLSLSLGIQL